MLVQVHDELVTSVPLNEERLWIPRIEEAMGHGTMFTDGATDDQGRPFKPVKLVVEAHAAGSWAEAKG
jgi:DNA polymerase I-like protein with 3'-5' exonuclease and polymerase domains